MPMAMVQQVVAGTFTAATGSEPFVLSLQGIYCEMGTFVNALGGRGFRHLASGYHLQRGSSVALKGTP